MKNVSMKKIPEAFLYLILVVCIIAWAFDFLGLAISSGSPHFEGSGWSQARIDDYMHTVKILTLWFYILPLLIACDITGLWLVRRWQKVT